MKTKYVLSVSLVCHTIPTLSVDNVADDDVSAHLGKATLSFGRLTKRLRNERGIRLSANINVYWAVVLSTVV